METSLRSFAYLALVALQLMGAARSACAQCELPPLTAPSPAAGDQLGIAVAAQDDRVAIGAWGDSTVAPEAGAAFVFANNAGVFLPSQRLTASDAAPQDRLGSAVALSTNWLAVAATGDDDAGESSGSVYLFHDSGSAWVEEQKLTASDADMFDQFGFALALEGDTLLVGARFGDSATLDDTGCVYVFRNNGSSWVEVFKLTAGDGAFNDGFGWSIAVSGQKAVIGAPLDDDFFPESGSAYVFRFDNSVWLEEGKLTQAGAGEFERFGFAVDLGGDIVVGGMPQRDDTNGSINVGAAAVFRFDGALWNEEQALTPSDGEPFDSFGTTVALTGDRVVIGSPLEDTAGFNAGSAYVFDYDGTLWQETQKLLPTGGLDMDEFASSLAIDAEFLVAGAPRQDIGSTDAGAAYVFVVAGEDCNNNGTPDLCDIYTGTSQDPDGNGIPSECTRFSRGDCNADGNTNLIDVIHFLGYLFPVQLDSDGLPLPNALPCEDACDSNDDGSLALPDVIALLTALFGAPPQPLPTPYPNCGDDLTNDVLDCSTFAPCP